MPKQSTKSDPRPTRSSRAIAAAKKGGASVAKGGSEDASDAGIRVLCVDDHAVLVDGLKAQFVLDRRITCVGSLPSAEQLLDQVARLKPHVVLLDIEMPGPDAFESADRLRHMHPGSRVIILSAHVRNGYISAAFKCGAWGYFAKSDAPEAIVAGILEVARSPGGAKGVFIVGPKVKESCGSPSSAITSGSSVAGRFSKGRGTRRPASSAAAKRSSDGGAPTTRLDALSVREVEVLRLIGKGLSRSQIAGELSRAVKTIDGHQDNIMKKLGVESRADLMRLAIREGFAEA